MNLYLRLLKVLFRIASSRRRHALEPSRLAFRVWPTDCDLNLHMNNGRYLTLMDLGRIHLIGQMRLLRPLLARRWMPVLGAAEINFIRPLKPLQRFTLTTRLVTWDEKYFYIEQRFTAAHQLCAVATVRGLFVGARRAIPNADVLRLVGEDLPSPPPTPVVVQWNELLATKKRHA